jgi:hypothetical protein
VVAHGLGECAQRWQEHLPMLSPPPAPTSAQARAQRFANCSRRATHHTGVESSGPRSEPEPPLWRQVTYEARAWEREGRPGESRTQTMECVSGWYNNAEVGRFAAFRDDDAHTPQQGQLPRAHTVHVSPTALRAQYTLTALLSSVCAAGSHCRPLACSGSFGRPWSPQAASTTIGGATRCSAGCRSSCTGCSRVRCPPGTRPATGTGARTASSSPGSCDGAPT